MVGDKRCVIENESNTEINCVVISAEGIHTLSVGGALDTFEVTATESINCTVTGQGWVYCF